MAIFDKSFEAFKQKMIGRFDKAGLVLKDQMIMTVAQKTRRLEQSIKKNPVTVQGNAIEVTVGSEGVPYAIFVEKGVKGRVYQYHRLEGGGRKVVFVGVGMQWAKRALDEKIGEIVSIIKGN